MTRPPFPPSYVQALDGLLFDMAEMDRRHFDSTEYVMKRREKVTAFVRRWGRVLQVYEVLDKEPT